MRNTLSRPIRACLGAVLSLSIAGTANAVVINISGTANGEQTGGADCGVACQGPLINPVQVTFAAGTYTFYDAFNPVTGLAPGALYDAWNFQAGNPHAWAWHWKALLDDGAGGSTINPGNYANYILLDIDRRNPEDTFATEAEAAAFGANTPPPTLTFTQTTTVNFVVNDYFLEDNAGGVSLTTEARVPSGVPEPAAWALMIGGFGVAGLSARRRRNTSVTFA